MCTLEYLELSQLHESISIVTSVSRQSALKSTITYIVLEPSQIIRSQSIRFAHDGDQIDSRSESLHDFDIEGFESVTSWSNEVKTGVDSHVYFLASLGLLFLTHEGLMLIILRRRRDESQHL